MDDTDNKKRKIRENLIIKISGRERANGYLWYITAIFGIAWGLLYVANDHFAWFIWPPYLFDWSIYGFLVLAAGIANLFVARASLKRSRNLVKESSNIVEEYDRRLPQYLIVLLYNIFFGFGFLLRFVPSILALVNRNYVLRNRDILEVPGE
ncbi:MAG: hypothetical protein PHR78_06395 [Eubacteriales bacterium]|nr:hypothetical protein [Eubacteriales bacterium]